MQDYSNGAGNKLLAEVRRDRMVAYVERNGQITIEELVSHFDVSAMTIWRDLAALEERGRLRRVRGGATRLEQRSGQEPLYVNKKVVNLDRKEAIARYASQHFVADGDIIFMEAGTTVVAMAKYLKQYRQLTVIGNGLGTMNELVRLLPDITVYCCGGMLRDVALTFVGPQAEEYFQHVNARTCFLGATGITVAEGLTDVSLLEIQVKRVMAQSADRVVVMMDSTKFGAKSLGKLLDIDQLDVLITDDAVPDQFCVDLQRAGVDVHVVAVSGS
ncbi:MAG: DeoR/GlpR transcriptional regulator [Chloroflexi bacterium]|nr:DeoR/GlpR transcriptional regulator [Chloroflexota bacterium]